MARWLFTRLAVNQARPRLRDIPEEKRRLADALRVSAMAERGRLAAFVLDEATAFAANPSRPQRPAFEPLRVFRRLQLLRGWSHDEANSPFFA